jgi:hypothetical protein
MFKLQKTAEWSALRFWIVVMTAPWPLQKTTNIGLLQTKGA